MFNFQVTDDGLQIGYGLKMQGHKNIVTISTAIHPFLAPFLPSSIPPSLNLTSLETQIQALVKSICEPFFFFNL